MWNELQLSPAFFMQYVKQNKHHILLTDYIRIWEIHLSDKELLHCLMDSNTILEMEEEEILQNGVQLLTHPQDLKKVNIIYDGACLVISMTLFREFPFKLKLNFLEGSKELKVVQPALKTIYDLKSSENELRKLLKKKDEEIDEYILQSRKIRYTSLPKYNDEVHMKKHSEYSTNFGTGEIPSTLLKKTVNIFKENDIEDTNVKIPVKIEPQSQEITTDQPPMNSLIQVKQECIKNELPKPKKRRNQKHLRAQVAYLHPVVTSSSSSDSDSCEGQKDTLNVGSGKFRIHCGILYHKITRILSCIRVYTHVYSIIM